MHVERTLQRPGGICHHQLINAELLHERNSFYRQFFGADGFGVGRHHVANGDRLQIQLFFEGAAQVTIGEDAQHFLCVIADNGHAESAPRDGQDGIGERTVRSDGWDFCGCVHHITDMRQQTTPQGTARM